MKSVKSKPRIVLDTNVWVSGLVFAGQPGKILDLFGLDEVRIVISEELLSELRRIITEKFPLYILDLQLLIEAIHQRALLVELGSQTVTASRDPDDNTVIETALIGNCKYIVSGDKDLLVIANYEDIQIITPAEFLELISKP